MLKKIILLLLIVLVTSCGTTHTLKNQFKKESEDNSFFKGFVLYNPIKKKILINHNGNKYFTPASNTKLVTFYTAYKTLGDSILGLEYYKTSDSLIIKGTADPSLFYGFSNTKTADFLKKSTLPIYLVNASIEDEKYGDGWAWDDYPYYYMPEKSLLPIFGNLLTYTTNKDSITVNIPTFKDKIFVADTLLRRETTTNKFYAQKGKDKTYKVPFVTSNKLVAKILSNQISKKITLIPTKNYRFKPFYSLKSDSLYTKLLVESDNFIAEQLLLQVGKKVSGKYSVKKAIEYSLANYLQDLPQKPRWIDGSGLSRYNLFTPNDFIVILEKLYTEIPQKKLLQYFAVGGKTGTLQKWYGNKKPFVYAKSGSLSNNYNLSGYLITKKGTFLLFSYMNNHFKESSSKIKKDIQKTLLKIYNTY